MPALKNKRHEQFCHEYMIDFNGSASWRRCGGSTRTANRQASHLLSKPVIEARIAELMEERTERTKLTADKILTRLSEMADIDIGQAYDEHGDLRPLNEIPLHLRRAIVGIEVVEDRVNNRVRKVRFVDRLRALELAGKHVDVQAFRDQHGLGGPDGGPIVQEVRRIIVDPEKTEDPAE